MISHRTCRALFVEALYGELDRETRDGFDAHLRSCPACTQEFQEMSNVVSVMRERERPSKTQQDWVSFWNLLSARIGREAQPDARGLSRHPSFWWTPTVRLAGAAIVVLVVGIVIGRMTFNDGSAEQDDDPSLPAAERVVLKQETMEYLDRSKILLLGIVNGGGRDADDMRLTRPHERSRRLVTEGTALRARLEDAEFRRLSNLVEELEVLLLQIANLQAENNFPGLEIIRDGVKRKGILLKINLEQMRVEGADRGIEPEPTHDRQRSSI